MRRVKLQMQISMDGFSAGIDGEMDWPVQNWDNRLKKQVNEMAETVDCILLGRKSVQSFIDFWDSRIDSKDGGDFELARKMLNIPKVVFTKTLTINEWGNTILAKTDVVDEIAELKSRSGGDIMVFGGGSFVSALIKHNLVDQYNLFINPVALGSGIAILAGIKKKLNLKLINTIYYSCGIVVCRYEKV